MDAWPTPQERGITEGRPGRHCEALREVRAAALRLEETAERKLTRRETDMAMTRKVDADGIRADAAAGLSQTAIAEKHHCSRSTVSTYLHPKEPSAAKAMNGAGKALATPRMARGVEPAELASLEALAAAAWERLPIVERLRLLLSCGSA